VNEPLRAADVELEIRIKASKAAVWNALVHDIAEWWPKQAFMTKARTLSFEPHVGGRVFEDKGDGTGGIWWHVHAIETGDYVVLLGHTWPGQGGPATSIAKLTLEDRKGQTILKIHDSMFGRLTDERVASIKQGWEGLFAKGLKPYIETGLTQ
jgi:uncharacterized protein YndB with AHSA1/START domain